MVCVRCLGHSKSTRLEDLDLTTLQLLAQVSEKAEHLDLEMVSPAFENSQSFQNFPISYPTEAKSFPTVFLES